MTSVFNFCIFFCQMETLLFSAQNWNHLKISPHSLQWPVDALKWSQQESLSDELGFNFFLTKKEETPKNYIFVVGEWHLSMTTWLSEILCNWALCHLLSLSNSVKPLRQNLTTDLTLKFFSFGTLYCHLVVAIDNYIWMLEAFRISKPKSKLSFIYFYFSWKNTLYS